MHLRKRQNWLGIVSYFQNLDKFFNVSKHKKTFREELEIKEPPQNARISSTTKLSKIYGKNHLALKANRTRILD